MNKDIILDTPIKLVFEIHNLLLENPGVSKSFKRQSEILDVPLNDIQVV